MSALRPLLSAMLLTITTSALALPSEAPLQTQDFQDVRDAIDQAVAEHGAGQVLVLFDIDNTTLATEQDIASEHWFLWQSEMIKAGDFTNGAVAKTVPDALRLQGYLLNMMQMRPTEARIGQDVKELAEAGVRFAAVTSRMLDVRDSTQREFARAGIDLATPAPGPAGGFAGAYLPYEPARPDAYGLTADDVERFKLTEPKPVIFENGVMYTQGQHKGSMLKTLLAKTGAKVSAIVFVDDRPHHLEGVRQAFEARPEAVTTVQYQHEKPRIDAFNASDKAKVKSQWTTFCQGLSALTVVELCDR